MAWCLKTAPGLDEYLEMPSLRRHALIEALDVRIERHNEQVERDRKNR